MDRYIIGVPGYGVPDSERSNDAIRCYILGIVTHLTEEIPLNSRDTSVHLVFLGGATNPKSKVTEAAILDRAWRERPQTLRDLTWRVVTEAHGDGLSFWENLLTLRTLAARHRATHIIVFCEKHRFRRCNYLVHECFAKAPQRITVVPIDFDTRVYTVLDHLMRWFEYKAAVMSMNVPGFHRLERWLRGIKIGQ